jgi:hypothetical protein
MGYVLAASKDVLSHLSDIVLNGILNSTSEKQKGIISRARCSIDGYSSCHRGSSLSI